MIGATERRNPIGSDARASHRRPFRQIVGWVAVGCALIVVGSSCRSPYYADRGAAMGGLAGAGIGAAIGEANDNAAAGALLGSAMGAMTGSVVGNEMDQARADEAMLAEQQAQAQRNATTFADVVAMTNAGLGDDVIVTQLQTRGVSHPPNTQEIIRLKNQGVSDTVIGAIQNLSVAPAPVATPVIVEEHIVPRPVPFWGAGLHLHHGPRYRRRVRRVARPPRPGFSWGVSFTN